MERNTVVIGQLIRNKRLEKRIGVRELSRDIGVSPSYISQLEKGVYKKPSDEVLLNIFNVLNFEEKYKSVFGLSDSHTETKEDQIKNNELKRILIEKLIDQMENMDTSEIELYALFFQGYRDVMVKIIEIEKKANDRAKTIHSIREYVDFLYNKHVVNRLSRLFD
ncbi:helix-turn-helix transcriptional regulator [Neobacillus sp. PS3-40]|uniref:helix-turn-helix domain-containing protein n=1 Tax=Neobacillus sp. PS3-40 TaxID=3070679 RepID=UPI0027E0F736|nr:helix-turn-helix transcriptional regulator [Neobacillus sp. PS3-40]WML45394.1 helix-turn-helix transcriptional regulator [Neobacillus sp. PS3-40]